LPYLSVGQLDNLMFWILVQNPVQNLNLFSLDRFWTDHMIKKLILARIMINFGQYLISTKLLTFKKLYKSHINAKLIINQVYEFNKLFSSSLYFYNLLQNPILYYHNILIFSQY
jgi:hypothetical protein